jgi:hypothetical protein
MGPFSRFQFERVSVPRAYCGELVSAVRAEFISSARSHLR